MFSKETVQIIGLGYVGLPTALLIANCKKFKKVIGCDINKVLINDLNIGIKPLIEPGLDDLLKKAKKEHSIEFNLVPKQANIHIIAVPTPTESFNNKPDISLVENVISEISPLLESGNLIVIESTCPPGTTRHLREFVKSKRPDLNINDKLSIEFCYCPERVLPGNAISEIKNNQRVLGGLSQSAAERAKHLYSAFINAKIDISPVAEEAELSKLVENSYRDVNLAFANEISMMCIDNGINPNKVIDFANKHPRVNILNPGPGVGGHCIAVDPWFLIHWSGNMPLLKKARAVNLGKENWVVRQILNYCKTKNMKDIIVLGLTYKENVNDFRESPGLRTMEKLKINTEYSIIGEDPYYPKKITDDSPSLKEYMNKDSCLIVKLLNHKDYKFINSDTCKNYVQFF